MATRLFSPSKAAAALLALVFRAAAADPGADGAQSELKQLSLEELANVEVVTVAKKPVTINRTPAGVYVITQEDIRRSGATSIPEALRLAPGVEVARIDATKWAIGIRGFQSRLSRGVLVLIDGRTVYSPLFHGVYWEVQDTLMEDIDRIEVIRGPGGTIWGANAVNGVINIITKNSKDTQGTLVAAGGGTVNQAFAQTRYGGGNGKNFTYRVYGKGNTRAPAFHWNGRNFDDWRRAQGGFRADWDSGGRNQVTVQGDIYSGENGESVRITSYTPPALNIVEENALLSGGNLMGRWHRTLENGSDFQLQVYYDRVNRQEPNQTEIRNTFDVDFVHHLRLPGRQDFTWGLGARFSLGDLPAVVPTYIFQPNNRLDQLYSAFVQDALPLAGERLQLTFGSKILHSSFTGVDVEPSVRLLWTPTARHSFWAALTRAVRTPSDLEDTQEITSLRSAAQASFNRTTGDSAFTSETSIGVEAGYRQIIRSNLSVDLALFQNHYDNLLSLEPGQPFLETAPAPPHTIYPIFSRNGIQGQTTGFELVGDWKPAPWWRLQGSYSFLRMDFERQAGSLDATTVTSLEGSSPRHDIGVQSYVDLPGNLQFSQIYRFVSRLPALAVPSYSTIDARLGWSPVHGVELSVTGQNLLQPHHAEFAGDPGGLVGIKRGIYAAVTFRQ